MWLGCWEAILLQPSISGTKPFTRLARPHANIMRVSSVRVGTNLRMSAMVTRLLRAAW